MKEVKIVILGHRPRSGKFNLPENWNEVPEHQYPFLADIYLSPEETIAQRISKTVKAFLLLTSKKKRLIAQLNSRQVSGLLPEIDWVFDQLDITRNLLPKLKLQKRWYYGPADELKNMRFGEWCIADTLFVEYSKHSSDAILNRLTACLYRPQGTGNDFIPGKETYRGDMREKFNDSLLDSRELLMAQLPAVVKKGIFLWFASCRQRLISTYDKVFEAPKPGADASRMSVYGWFGIYDDLRGDPKYAGQPEKLEDEFISTVFVSATRNHYKMKEMSK